MANKSSFKHKLTLKISNCLLKIYGIKPSLLYFIPKILISSNPRRIKIARRNLELCFPHHNKKRLLKQNITATLDSIFDLIAATNNQQISVTINNSTALTNQLHQPGGLLIIHPHTIHLNLAGMLLYQLTLQHSNKPYGYIFRPGKTPDNLLQYIRQQLGPKATWIKAHETKRCIKFLQQGGVLMTFPDHDLGIKRSTFVDFFKISTATCPGFAKMAAIANVPCIATYLIKNNNKFELTIEDPKMLEFNTASIWLNTWLETMIKQHPEQYFWLHRRFKTRPLGKSSLYENLK